MCMCVCVCELTLLLLAKNEALKVSLDFWRLTRRQLIYTFSPTSRMASEISAGYLCVCLNGFRVFADFRRHYRHSRHCVWQYLDMRTLQLIYSCSCFESGRGSCKILWFEGAIQLHGWPQSFLNKFQHSLDIQLKWYSRLYKMNCPHDLKLKKNGTCCPPISLSLKTPFKLKAKETSKR